MLAACWALIYLAPAIGEVAQTKRAVPVEDAGKRQRGVPSFEEIVLFHGQDAPDPNDYAQLRESAQKGDPNAEYRLAYYHCRHTKDMTEMVKWLRAAALQNHVKAQIALGHCYEGGTGVSKDAAEAVAWYRRAAELGAPDAQYTLGCRYYWPEGVQQDYAEAMKWFTKAAEQGVVEAQYFLGGMYARGDGVPQNDRESVKWFRKAAEPGNAEAQVWLGYSYFLGTGVPQDRMEAVRWLTKAAEQGNLRAQVHLGSTYARGDGIPQDWVKAAGWYTKAAEQGDSGSQAILGLKYRFGGDIPRDDKKAAKWLAKAAEQGVVAAQYFLGDMYKQGDGVPQNDRESVKWFRKAAEQGLAQAQLALGERYHSGSGVPEDYAEAYKWLILALSKGVGEPGGFPDRDTLIRAREARDLFRNKLTPSQIEEGQRRAKDFLAEQEGRAKQGAQRMANATTAASGFFIMADGYILTARHAVEKAARVEVIHREKTYPAKVILKDESTDVAILKIEGAEFTSLPLVSSAMMKAGDSVFTLGFPQVRVQGTEAKFTEGSISALSGLGGSPRFFQISVPVQPGNSGGPLVNENGEVVGLIVSRLDDVAALMSTGAVPQTVNYALKSSFILPLIESVPGLAEKLPKSSAVKDRSVAIEKAKSAVVLIVGYNDAPVR